MPPLSQKSYRLFWGPYINCNRETNSFFHRIASIHEESRWQSGSLCISARVRVHYIIVFRHAINPTAEGILAIYPPKLSNMIMSSSTPNEWSKSSTVLDIIGGPRRKWLARRNSHTSLACRTSSSPQKLKIFGGPAYYGYLCGSSPMKKTVFDLLHSLDIKIQYIQ